MVSSGKEWWTSGTKWGAMWGLTIRERIPDVIRRV